MKRKEETSGEGGSGGKKRRVGGPAWTRVLEDRMDSVLAQGSHLRKTDELVAFHDAYPKARRHALVCPLNRLAGLEALGKDHIPLLRDMADMANQLAEEWTSQGMRVRIGFHAIPSLRPLHLHVISVDFVSTALKTKKHWNSFNTAFFRSVEEVVGELEAEGRVDTDPKRWEPLLTTSLKCSHCQQTFPNIPKLKAHLVLVENKVSSTK